MDNVCSETVIISYIRELNSLGKWELLIFFFNPQGEGEYNAIYKNLSY